MIQVAYTNSEYWCSFEFKVNEKLKELQESGRKIVSIKKIDGTLVVEIVHADIDDDVSNYIGA